MIPSFISPDTSSPGEKDLFERFREEAGTEDWTVLHSFNLPRHVTQVEGECDFVVLVPGLGILCLEVKAHKRVAYNPDGSWLLGNEKTKRGPFKQAKDNMRSLMAVLESRRKDLAGATLIWSAVAFTDTDFRVPAVEWHAWEVIDAADLGKRTLSDIVTGILEKARAVVWHKSADGSPTAGDCQAVVKVLRPSFEVLQTPSQKRAQTLDDLKRFTEEQYEAIDRMVRNPRVIFEGPAGTGKTLLALEAARRASAKGERVALICFNRLLGRWLSGQAKDIPGVTVGTIHRLMRSIAGVKPPDPAPVGYFENVLPELAAGALLESRDLPPFDVLIVDEAQDILRDSYLEFLDLAVQDGLSGGRWSFFGDFHRQALYDAADMDVDDFLAKYPVAASYTLGVNCRNTQRIAQWVTMMSSLEPGYSSVRRPEPGPPPRTRYFAARFAGDHESQVEILTRDVLPGIERDGFKGEDIVLLSPVRDCAATSLPSPWKDRLRTWETANSPGHVRYSTISAVKGLEAPVVILTDITGVVDDRSRSLFYTGATRATEQLWVLAHDGLREQFGELLDTARGQAANV